jgi:hypothetical protein
MDPIPKRGVENGPNPQTRSGEWRLGSGEWTQSPNEKWRMEIGEWRMDPIPKLQSPNNFLLFSSSTTKNIHSSILFKIKSKFTN